MRLIGPGHLPQRLRCVVLGSSGNPGSEPADLLVGQCGLSEGHARLALTQQKSKDEASFGVRGDEGSAALTALLEPLIVGQVKTTLFHRGLLTPLALGLNSGPDLPSITDGFSCLPCFQAARLETRRPQQENKDRKSATHGTIFENSPNHRQVDQKRQLGSRGIPRYKIQTSSKHQFSKGPGKPGSTFELG